MYIKKNNDRGICMFAIDCLKANGTHLGTCIDRFYFGSCCRIEPMHDIVGNTIDTAIIPSRQPPSRISNTTPKTTTTTTTITTTTEKTANTTLTITTTTPKITQPTTLTSFTPTTQSITNTTDPILTTENSKIQINATQTNLITTPKIPDVSSHFSEYISNVSSLEPVIFQTTENFYKLTTFQTVEENSVNVETLTNKPTVAAVTTLKPESTTNKVLLQTISYTTTRPSPTPFRPRPTYHKSTTRPRPSGTTKPTKVTKPTSKVTFLSTKVTKPVKGSTKPSKVTTKKPVVTTLSTTPFSKTTRRPVTTKTTTTTKEPATVKLKTTTRPTTTTSKSTTTTVVSTTTTTTTKQSTTATAYNLTTQPTVNVPTTPSNEVVVINSGVGAISGNPVTNEIEQVKPLQPLTIAETTTPSLITWTVTNEESTSKPTTLSEEWMPITTPDGWVLLPSLSTLFPGVTTPTVTTLINKTSNNETSSENPLEIATSTTSAYDYSTEITTVNNSVTNAGNTSAVSITTTASMDAVSTMQPSAVNMSDFTDVCGRRMYPEARIVGGERATFGKWPWQISLRQWRTSTYLHKCGAALLNENWAITAAHCVDNVPPSDLLLRLGEHDLSTDSEPYIHQERRVQIVASHPQFDPRTFEYDLALLRFYEPVQFQPNIVPVCVPNSDENFVGRTAYVTGWGRLYEDGPLPSVLQEVAVPVINNSVCESMYRSAGYIEHIPHIFICAGWRRGGFDSCEGDSGGPMVIQRSDKRFLLAGVISWGIGCAEPNQPGVYTRISEFREWINQILQF